MLVVNMNVMMKDYYDEKDDYKGKEDGDENDD